MDERAIEIRGLGKRYGEVVALQSLDLDVPRGSIFGFLGPNGSGKTTAMRILLGLARPTSGRASVLGFDVVGDSLEIRRRVGYLAQLPRFYEELTPRETLRFSLGFFPHDAEDRIEDEVADALDLVGIRDKADHRVGGLSGGQRQRLGIAQAYVHRPELLVLDEPAAALDPIGRRDVLDIMRRLKGSTTIFYSTHILDDVERVSDDVAVLDHGRRLAQAPIEELLTGSSAGELSFVVEIRGGADEAVRRLEQEPWVTAVREEPVETRTRLRVLVDDPDAAEEELLRLLLRIDGLRVVSYAAHRLALEDVFVKLVEEVPA
jgi:ABC-2 type transport system ATP-binding protein